MTTPATQPNRPTKALKFQVKDADKGLVEAIFATFDVIDHDNDVTLKGAFQDGAPVPVGAFGHGSVGWIGTDPPIGKGVIRVTEKDARIEAELFLGTTAGKETFEVIKAMGEMQQWSYWYDPIEWEMGMKDNVRVRFLKKLTVHEVCPVLIGAGIGTHTVDVKGATPAPATDPVAAAELAGQLLRFEKTRARIILGH